MRRLAAVVLIVLGIGLLLGQNRSIARAVFGKSKTITSTIPDDLKSIVIKADNGDVTVRTGTTPKLTRTEHWTFERPRVDISTDNGTMTVAVRCPPGLFSRCSVDLDAAVPSTTGVAVTTTNGDVAVSGVEGERVAVHTTNGDVAIANVRTETKVTTTNGDVHAEHLHNPLNIKTTNGDVDALVDDKTSAAIRTTNGDVTLTVPEGAYALDVHASHGDVGQHGITDDSKSNDALSVQTNNGDITITGR